MELENKFNIEQFLSLEGYNTDERVSRRKNSEVNSQEFFTPYSIVKRMCEKIPDEDWSDPDKTFLEPCAGNFQFGVYMIYNRLLHGIDWRTALNTLYMTELMQDNIDEGKERIRIMLRELCNDFDESEANDIMDKNIVCTDFFKWDYENWRPL